MNIGGAEESVWKEEERRGGRAGRESGEVERAGPPASDVGAIERRLVQTTLTQGHHPRLQTAAPVCLPSRHRQLQPRVAVVCAKAVVSNKGAFEHIVQDSNEAHVKRENGREACENQIQAPLPGVRNPDARGRHIVAHLTPIPPGEDLSNEP